MEAGLNLSVVKGRPDTVMSNLFVCHDYFVFGDVKLEREDVTIRRDVEGGTIFFFLIEIKQRGVHAPLLCSLLFFLISEMAVSLQTAPKAEERFFPI